MKIIYEIEPESPDQLDAILMTGLQELFPDPGYELNNLHVDDLDILQKTRKEFGKRGYFPIPYLELKRAIHLIIKEKYGKFQHQVDINILLFAWWRNGQTRRFAKYRSRSTRPGRGGWSGVHYILYPEGEEWIE